MAPQPEYKDRRLHLAELQRAALAAADAGAAVRRHLSVRGKTLFAGGRWLDLAGGGRLFSISIGKAGPAMARAASSLLKDHVVEGLVTRHAELGEDAGKPLPARWQSVSAEHPLPGRGSLEAGRRAAAMMAKTVVGDGILVLVSGGGSAMIELPRPGVSLEALRQMNELLIGSGAPIQEINLVRASLSQIKAGGLARLASPAQTMALILSDVVGDRLGSVASGPTVLLRSRPPRARGVLRAYGIWERVPAAVRAALKASDRPTAGARRPINVLVGNNRIVVEAVADRSRELGFRPKIITRSMRGEARVAGRRLAARLHNAAPGDCLLMGGETTVTVRGNGHGGRNQEFALSAALELEGGRHFAILTLGTDGLDGPTDAAGAICDDASIARAQGMGFDPGSALAQNDAYPLLEAIDCLVKTGPTGTNLNDIAIGLKYS